MTTVVILEDAAEDLESGAQFYESCATGVGDYFLDSILSDLDSLILFAGVHLNLVAGRRPQIPNEQFRRMLSYDKEVRILTFDQISAS